MKKTILLLSSAMFLNLFINISVNAESSQTKKIPAGIYTLDTLHASLIFTVSHIGFSKYTAGFDTFDATLKLDPNNLKTASVEATIDPRSLDIPSPPAGFIEELLSANWLNASEFPRITFKSNKVEVTGNNTARVHGELSLHGIKAPVMMDTVFNGGYASHPMEPRARVGFSAKGQFKRSLFGISYGIPEPGTTMGVGDLIEFFIEAEFSGPPLTTHKATEK